MQLIDEVLRLCPGVEVLDVVAMELVCQLIEGLVAQEDEARREATLLLLR